eukprot:1195650-Prorocentrum_minimum.AAC.3
MGRVISFPEVSAWRVQRFRARHLFNASDPEGRVEAAKVRTHLTYSYMFVVHLTLSLRSTFARIHNTSEQPSIRTSVTMHPTNTPNL